MLRRIELDDRRVSAGPSTQLGLPPSLPIVPAIADLEFDGSLLPHDHPAWAKDALTVSTRARDWIAALKPVVMHVLRFWDHRIRAAVVGGARVCIDASGSYRVE